MICHASGNTENNKEYKKENKKRLVLFLQSSILSAALSSVSFSFVILYSKEGKGPRKQEGRYKSPGKVEKQAEESRRSPLFSLFVFLLSNSEKKQENPPVRPRQNQRALKPILVGKNGYSRDFQAVDRQQEA